MYHNEHRVKHRIVESLPWTPETKITPYVNYTGIKIKDLIKNIPAFSNFEICRLPSSLLPAPRTPYSQSTLLHIKIRKLKRNSSRIRALREESLCNSPPKRTIFRCHSAPLSSRMRGVYEPASGRQYGASSGSSRGHAVVEGWMKAGRAQKIESLPLSISA